MKLQSYNASQFTQKITVLFLNEVEPNQKFPLKYSFLSCEGKYEEAIKFLATTVKKGKILRH
jgi:hypothetical protein